MLKLNDVLLIGPYTYTVVGVKGRWAVVSFKTKDGNEKLVTVKQNRATQLKAA